MISLKKIADQVGVNFLEEPPLPTYRAMVNSCIQDINALNIKPKEIINIKGVDGNWGEVESTWGSIETSWSDLGAFIEGFTYDSTENKLIMPDSIDSLGNIYVDGAEWLPDSLENVISTYPNTNTYCRVGNCIYFSKDISDEDITVRINVMVNYTEIANGSDDILLRDDFTSYLVSAVTAKLSVTQKYRDADLYAISSRELKEKLSKISETEMSKNTPPYVNFGKGDGLEYY